MPSQSRAVASASGTGVRVRWPRTLRGAALGDDAQDLPPETVGHYRTGIDRRRVEPPLECILGLGRAHPFVELGDDRWHTVKVVANPARSRRPPHT